MSNKQIENKINKWHDSNTKKTFKQVKKIVYEDGTKLEIKYNHTYFLLVEDKVNEDKTYVDFTMSYNYSKLLSKPFIDQIFSNSIIFKLMNDNNIPYDVAYITYHEEMQKQRLQANIMKKFNYKDDN